MTFCRKEMLNGGDSLGKLAAVPVTNGEKTQSLGHKPGSPYLTIRAL